MFCIPVYNVSITHKLYAERLLQYRETSSPSPKETKLPSQKPRLMQKPCISFFQLHKHQNEHGNLRSDMTYFLLDGFQTKSAVWHMLPKQ